MTNTVFDHMENCIHWRRVVTELKVLTISADVQSYFSYESCGNDKDLSRFCIYGYLLPRAEPYKNGAFKVRITLPNDFPFKSPTLTLLTYIYHPAIDDHITSPAFCPECPHGFWTPAMRIGQWVEQYVDIIDRRDASLRTYCIRNRIAEWQYHRERQKYERKALEMVKQYSHPRPNRSVVTLKFLMKQKICERLNFNTAKIDRLPLCDSLKSYLNASLHTF